MSTLVIGFISPLSCIVVICLSGSEFVNAYLKLDFCRAIPRYRHPQDQDRGERYFDKLVITLPLLLSCLLLS